MWLTENEPAKECDSLTEEEEGQEEEREDKLKDSQTEEGATGKQIDEKAPSFLPLMVLLKLSFLLQSL